MALVVLGLGAIAPIHWTTLRFAELVAIVEIVRVVATSRLVSRRPVDVPLDSIVPTTEL